MSAVQPPTAGPLKSHEVASQHEADDHHVIGDVAVRVLIERYVELSGALLRALRHDLHELAVPRDDRTAFGGRATIRIAFSVEALQEDADAEMAVLGSAFVEQLVSAVRRRGARRVAGLVPPTIPAAPEAARLPVPVSNGTAGVPMVREGKHPVGRLTARVTVRAGASVDEHLVESSLFDLATGVRLGADTAAACERATAAGALESVASHDVLPARPMAEVVPLMLGDLEARLGPDVGRQRDAAQRALAHELARIDRYYTGLLADAGGRGSDVPDADTRRAFEAEHHRRRDEEIRRHEVRATVHPLQMAEWALPVQRAEWRLATSGGDAALLVAQRALVGDGAWTLDCPTCGTDAPAAFIVCHHSHAGCATCAATCTVCGSGFCRDHGLMACHVDGRPACDDHKRTCRSCRRQHCVAHEGRCVDGDHAACVTCLGACAHCGRTICDGHAAVTAADAPRGVRRLCAQCVRHCEGGTGEIVGPDEATRCASCKRYVCSRHQTACAVDGRVHCSKHMRRTDRSRRLVCKKDQAKCWYEPNAIFATDEVAPCATCETVACAEHTGVCVVDGLRHCTVHLVTLRDRGGALACAQHVTICHVDREAFSPDGTTECPVCGLRACAAHRRDCEHCGRSVCTAEYGGASGGGGARRCVTCRQLAETTDPDDRLLGAVALAQGGERVRAKTWRMARDATHVILELDLGWTRRLVLAVRHGADHAETVMSHSLFGSRRR